MRWDESELRLALALYCQLPFGRMHSRNPDVIKLAAKIDRSASAVAMKLVNFASLDPAIVNSGRAGLGNASVLDKIVWERFQRNWNAEIVDATEELGETTDSSPELEEDFPEAIDTTRSAVVELRRKQHIFRRMVLSSYDGVCCMSGLSEPRLLVASHIIPWNRREESRLDPRNGLCLSALHDRAFDRGLVTILPDLSILVSSLIKKLPEDGFLQASLLSCHMKPITRPQKFLPDPTLLQWHNENVFIP